MGMTIDCRDNIHCIYQSRYFFFFFFFQAEDGIRDLTVTGVQTCALPIYSTSIRLGFSCNGHCESSAVAVGRRRSGGRQSRPRSEEHTSELQSQSNLVCRLLLEKKNSHASRTASATISVYN